MKEINWEERTWDLYKSAVASSVYVEPAFDLAKNAVDYYKMMMEMDEPKEEEPKKKRTSKKSTFDVREDLSYVDPNFLPLWMEWLDYKDQINKQYKTQNGATTQYTTWLKFSDNDLTIANALIRRSIENSWQGFFDLTDAQKEFYKSEKSPYAKINEEKKEETKEKTLKIGGTTYR